MPAAGAKPTVIAGATRDAEQIVTFLRQRDYQLVRELGQGACGKTVLLRDTYLDEHYVCKKYVPHDESQRQALFEHFVKEVKLLHVLHHRNVVRVFNHYLFPEKCTGYILMEFVNGAPIDRYVAAHPDKISDLFIQAVTGFSYLEQVDVLHRDIRVDNLMVTDDGTLKIIDLGFGKRVRVSTDFAKSISLNWAYPPPDDFAQSRYDFATELYFVGMLFQDLINRHGLAHFTHKAALRKMCEKNPADRCSGFRDIDQEIGTRRFQDIAFNEWQLTDYRRFADAVVAHVTKIEAHAKYADDPDKLVEQIGAAWRSFMLEEFVPDNAPVLRCLISGQFYLKKQGMRVEVVKGFFDLMRQSAPDERRVILANLRTRLDAIPHYTETPPEMEADDIPF